MKKNKIAFDDKMKLLEHIKKIWLNPNIWWKKKNIQNLRVNYLKNYFNTIDNLKYTWKKTNLTKLKYSKNLKLVKTN